MHDEVAVRVLDRLQHLLKQRQACGEIEPLLARVHGERHAIDEVHHAVRVAVGEHAAIQQARDVGMLEVSQDAPLDDEAFDVLGGAAAQDLDCDALFEIPADRVARNTRHPNRRRR